MTITSINTKAECGHRIDQSQIPFAVGGNCLVSMTIGEHLGAPVSDVLKYLWATQDRNGISTLVFNNNPHAKSIQVFRDQIDGPWIVTEEDFDLNKEDPLNVFGSVEEAFEHACYEIDISEGNEITVKWRSSFTHIVDPKTGIHTSVPRTDHQ